MPVIAPRTLLAASRSVGENRHGIRGRVKTVQSRGRSSKAANTGECSVSTLQKRCKKGGGLRVAHLRFDKDGTEAIEELVWGNNLALYQSAGQHSRSRPPSGADRHFPEPGFEGQPAPVAHHLIHARKRAALMAGCFVSQGLRSVGKKQI